MANDDEQVPLLAEGLKEFLGKNDSDVKPTPTLPDMSPATRRDEKTEVVCGQTSVRHPPPPPAVSTVDGLEEVTQMAFRSFAIV